jgi:heterodisulfide reductase subunit A
MVAVGKHRNVELLTYAEVVGVSGYIGNFKVKIRKKARYVDIEKCNGCGVCWGECPSTTVPGKRRIVIDKRLIREKAL